MLPSGLWQENEPRFGFPVFGDCVNRVSQAIRLDFGSYNWKKAAKIGLAQVKRGRLPRLSVLLPRLGDPVAMKVRGALTTRRGEFIRDFGPIGAWNAGQSFEINVNEIMARHGMTMQDAMFLLIMSLGGNTDALSDVNSFSMTYEGESFYTNYRTGAFARTLNDFSKKKHVGFLSVNPKIIVNDTHLSSLMFIHHSSNLAYEETVNPRVQLFRTDGAILEADFGPLPAFSGIERTIEEVFGSEVREFLRPGGGLGTTVARVPGHTLAGISILRSRDGRTMSIEHTRPTQSYLLSGI
jgi:hypothetical protein